ncbi:hypothetical protein DCS_03408 [Drechmeria coniospora]|uniref:Uncharacterized protein n=1 Tax=Drechmeria coniospora TaxID=98403 RepID=A0A151GH28_DRECN|nr:hypothetical protein DCS_03408 [Drechmeria coniospora]KYK56408.1 hypothetical protein DCS_03408 [Drechmeria coniospora]
MFLLASSLLNLSLQGITNLTSAFPEPVYTKDYFHLLAVHLDEPDPGAGSAVTITAFTVAAAVNLAMAPAATSAAKSATTASTIADQICESATAAGDSSSTIVTTFITILVLGK